MTKTAVSLYYVTQHTTAAAPSNSTVLIFVFTITTDSAQNAPAVGIFAFVLFTAPYVIGTSMRLRCQLSSAG